MKRTRRRIREILPHVVLPACIILAWSASAFALNPALDVSQYAHTSWKIRDGFPKGQVLTIAQTPDGYLWLGTEFGLVYFDGVKNIPWQPPDQPLPSNLISNLLAARDGTLWIGTSKGLASWKDGKTTEYPDLAGHYIFKLLEDREGTIWASAALATGGKLCSFQKSSVNCSEAGGALGRGAFNLYEDRKGNLWAGVKNGLLRWKPGPPKFYPLEGNPNGIQALGEDDDGALLVGWRDGIQRFIDGKTDVYQPTANVERFKANSLFRDRDGELWIATMEGLLHVHGGRSDVFKQSDGLSGDITYALFEDREGNIWVTTSNGLDRFRDFVVTTFNVKQGLSSDVVSGVLADRDGSVWFSTFAGLNKWSNGQITTGANRPSAKGGSRSIAGKEGNLNDLKPNTLFQDDRGRIWLGTQAGFGYLENDQFIAVRGVPGGTVTSIAQDKDHNLWVANEHVGLFKLFDRSVVQQIPWSNLGHRDHASVIAADPLQPGLWVGFFLGGIAYFSDGLVRTSYSAADGLAEGRVSDIRFDHTGALWIATESGLSRLKNGQLATLTSKNGLPCNAIHWLMEDDTHALWLYTACGLVRIPVSELYSWTVAVDEHKAARPIIRVDVFDTSDGVRSLASVGHTSPQVTKSQDGKLWFIPWDGVSVIDPHHLPFNRLPPPVHIEQFIADRTSYDTTSVADGRLRLPPLIRDLQIDYSALSLVAPEKILFRYKLENWDRNWQEASNRRQAFYNNLPPGNYRFRVIACNNSGVWNEAGTFLDFTIAPAYYQTTWFRVLMVAVFVISLALIYQLRLKQVARQVRARMEERLEERERIARDLHDTLIQSVQGLILKFHAGIQQIPRDMPAYKALEKTLDHADEVLAEGRDRVRNLRTSTIPFGGLPAAFKRVVEETPQVDEVTFKTVVEGRLRELHPMVNEECYCIGREAIINALAHSGGDKVEVEITYDSSQFRLRVRDNGRGFDPKILQEGGRPNHWGLQGMRERADKIGAQLKLWSRQATGTEVELIVPGATAYQARNKSKSFRLRRSPSSTGE